MGKETDRVIKLMDNWSEKKCRALIISIHGEFVEQTPVDTGWAMNNWMPSVNIPISATVGSYDQNDPAQMLGGLAAILTWRFEDGPAWIANNVPYISRLNAGHSGQAPAGFVDKIIQSEVNKAKRKR